MAATRNSSTETAGQTTAIASGRQRKYISPFRQARIAAIFMLPALVFMSIFVVYPALYAAYLSMTNASLIRMDWNWVGLRNYVVFFQDSTALKVLKNTYTYVFTVIVFQFLVGLGLALALNSVKRARGFYGALLFLPWVFSNIMAVTVWKWFFNDTYGVINYYLQLIGLRPVQWLSNPDLAMVTVIVLNIWKGYPFSMVLLLAGLQNIPNELSEAARIDGAGRFGILRYVTLPLLAPVMAANIVLITIYTFNVFDLVYAMTGGGPVNATEIIGLFMYRQAFTSGRLGYGSAVAVLMFLLNLMITIVYLATLARSSFRAETN
jgi:multiple sugar transport system permease protein